jgi:hypothetical protein
MARPPAKSPFALLFAITSVLSAACFDTSSTITTADYPTVLTVDPTLFRGSLRCGAPNLERYVVTLFDVSVEGIPALRPTVPVPCQSLVSFGEPFVTPLHYYTATIQGFDRVVEPDPSGEGADAGNPKMLDPTSGEEVAPAWTTSCGALPPRPRADAEDDATDDGPTPYNPLRYPTQVLGKIEVILHGCLPLAATPDASVDDGSSGSDGSLDAGTSDVSTETSDVIEPDGGVPGDDGGGDGGTGDAAGTGDGGENADRGDDGGGDDGGGDGGGGDGGGGDDGGGDDAGSEDGGVEGGG